MIFMTFQLFMATVLPYFVKYKLIFIGLFAVVFVIVKITNHQLRKLEDF